MIEIKLMQKTNSLDCIQKKKVLKQIEQEKYDKTDRGKKYHLDRSCCHIKK